MSGENLSRDEVNRMIDAAISTAYARLSWIYGTLGGQNGNVSLLTAGATTNGQGVGGPTICALLQTTVKASGRFLWWASGIQAAAAATEVATMTITGQWGTGTVTLTGATTVANGINASVSSGVAGTGIAITAGGGNEFSLAAPGLTVGTGAVGCAFATGGIMGGSTAGAPIAKGDNAFLILKWTNSATNRQVSQMTMGLIELP